jgi:hypothetical protein
MPEVRGNSKSHIGQDWDTATSSFGHYSHSKMGTYSDAGPTLEPSAEVLDSIETTSALNTICNSGCAPVLSNWKMD